MIAIIDYGLGNLRSVAAAVKRLRHEVTVTNKHEELQQAEKLIMPGVGAFGDAMKNLHRLGLVGLLNRLVIQEKRPILGICLGSQLMAKESFEFGHHQGLGWIEASVLKIEPPDNKLRIPHVGWNDLIQLKEDFIFQGIPQEALFYYVHSYHIQIKNHDIIIGECEYGMRFVASFHQDNIYATQFHPEKSQLYGLKILENFLSRG